MEYLKLFNNENEYENSIREFDYPTVSCIKSNEIGDRIRIFDGTDYAINEYLTFIAQETGTFTLTIGRYVTTSQLSYVSYSLDNGETWTKTNNSSSAVTITTPTVNKGDTILWKGYGSTTSSTNTNYTSTYYSIFSSTGKFKVRGNIMSLLYDDNFKNQKTLTSSRNFRSLFENAKLTSAKKLKLPATTLTEFCYQGMFKNCTSLTEVPSVLPATELTNSCYYQMFYGCNKLIVAPDLPATTLATNCYYYMFTNCTLLSAAPELPAETTETSCYQSMFSGCTSLTKAPSILPATTLATYCYQYMFSACTSLTTAPVLKATTCNSNSCGSMFAGCTSLTTVPEFSATTVGYRCFESMFKNCTSLKTVPSDMLSATTLATYCYYYMFDGCQELTTAPILPAITLVENCYSYMFRGCNKLNYIKAMFTTVPSSTYTYAWVTGVAATGTFVKNSSASWNVTGSEGIPVGWTVQTASA